MRGALVLESRRVVQCTLQQLATCRAAARPGHICMSTETYLFAVGIISALCALFLILSLTITDLVAATGTTLIKGEVVQVVSIFLSLVQFLRHELWPAQRSTAPYRCSSIHWVLG